MYFMYSYNLEWILTIMFNVAISGKRKVNEWMIMHRQILMTLTSAQIRKLNTIWIADESSESIQHIYVKHYKHISNIYCGRTSWNSYGYCIYIFTQKDLLQLLCMSSQHPFELLRIIQITSKTKLHLNSMCNSTKVARSTVSGPARANRLERTDSSDPTQAKQLNSSTITSKLKDVLPQRT